MSTASFNALADWQASTEKCNLSAHEGTASAVHVVEELDGTVVAVGSPANPGRGGHRHAACHPERAVGWVAKDPCRRSICRNIGRRSFAPHPPPAQRGCVRRAKTFVVSSRGVPRSVFLVPRSMFRVQSLNHATARNTTRSSAATRPRALPGPGSRSARGRGWRRCGGGAGRRAGHCSRKSFPRNR